MSRRHLAAVRDVVFDFQGDGALRTPQDVAADEPEPEPVPDPQEETASLLDDLRSRRGVRQAVELDDDDSEEFEGFGPQHAFDFGRPDASVPGAHPVDADAAAEAQVYPAPVAVPGAGHHPGRGEHEDAERPARRAAVAPRCPAGTRSSSARSPSRPDRQMLSSSAEVSVCGLGEDARAVAAVMRRMWCRRHRTS